MEWFFAAPCTTRHLASENVSVSDGETAVVTVHEYGLQKSGTFDTVYTTIPQVIESKEKCKIKTNTTCWMVQFAGHFLH